MISTQPTSENIAAVLTLLQDTPRKLAALADDQPREALHQPLGQRERSFKENLVHLLNSEARLSEEIYLALLLDQPHLPRTHSKRDWGKLVHFQTVDLEDLLTYFQIRRKLLLNVLDDLEEESWSRTVKEEGKKRRESVFWKARALALHERDHMLDLKQKL
jgi:hypothetical protein